MSDPWWAPLLGSGWRELEAGRDAGVRRPHDVPVYRRHAVPSNAWTWPVSVFVVFTAVGILGGVGGDVATSLGNALATALAVIAVWCFTLAHVQRRRAVVLTPDRLVVGGDVLAVAEIDAAALARGDRRPRLPSRVLGVGQDPAFDGDVLAVPLRDGSRVGVPTADKPGLLAALRGVTRDSC